ncbi:MAG: glycosyltransferase [Spirochaetia bacterium]|nr:glycosyltransferase [Spirochaetia bacterium]
MERISIVVQRYSGVTGGSEALARYYAEALKSEFQVDILTTTAGDLDTWAEKFKAGTVQESGCNVMRFSVTGGRSNYWHALNALLIRQHAAQNGFVPWSVALQEEWIRRQGPHSEPLLEYIKLNQQHYACVLFFTYMYSHSYFGTMLVPGNRSRMIPTLHDEPAAYLRGFARSARRVKSILWNTGAEMALGNRLWGNVPGETIGMGIDVPPESPRNANGDPYIMYSGRIDPGKGCQELFEMFAMARDQIPRLRLVLTGQNYMKIPSGVGIEYSGFVSEEKKLDLMRNAICFCMPSGNESLSIATLEAMSVKTPVLVNGANPVLVEHIKESRGGLSYTNPGEFQIHVQTCLADQSVRESLGTNGRRYITEKYSHAVIRSKILNAVKAD